MKHSLSQEEKFKMMTDDPLPSVIIRLAIPTMISMLVTAFYNMADTFFVGQISTSATAAVGVAFPVMAVIQAAGFFVVMDLEIPCQENWEPKIMRQRNSLQRLVFILLFL